MIVRAREFTFHLPGAASLKDKRQVRRSMVDRVRGRFPAAAIAEVGCQDIHRTLTVGVAVVSGEAGHALELMEEIQRQLERYPEAELLSVTDIPMG